MNTTATPTTRFEEGFSGAPEVRGFQVCSRALTLATFVVALAGFAGTAFSAVPAEMFGQPAACIVSH